MVRTTAEVAILARVLVSLKRSETLRNELTGDALVVPGIVVYASSIGNDHASPT
jgi:hypothetical protein